MYVNVSFSAYLTFSERHELCWLLQHLWTRGAMKMKRLVCHFHIYTAYPRMTFFLQCLNMATDSQRSYKFIGRIGTSSWEPVAFILDEDGFFFSLLRKQFVNVKSKEGLLQNMGWILRKMPAYRRNGQFLLIPLSPDLSFPFHTWIYPLSSCY